jgi:hypothetical protein
MYISNIPRELFRTARSQSIKPDRLQEIPNPEGGAPFLAAPLDCTMELWLLLTPEDSLEQIIWIADQITILNLAKSLGVVDEHKAQLVAQIQAGFYPVSSVDSTEIEDVILHLFESSFSGTNSAHLKAFQLIGKITHLKAQCWPQRTRGVVN